MRRRVDAQRGGFALAELLTAVAISALVAVVSLLTLSSATRVIEAATVKSTADTLAEMVALHVKTELRFTDDVDGTIRALSGYTATLNGLSVESLTFSRSSDGAVVFRFTVAAYAYEYRTVPLNRAYNGSGAP